PPSCAQRPRVLVVVVDYPPLDDDYEHPHLPSQEPTRRDAGLAVAVDGHLSVDEHVAVADRPLNPPPLAGGGVRHLFHGRHAQALEVVDDEVGGFTLVERTAIAEARAVSRQSREFPMDVFERQNLVVARGAYYGLGRIAPGREEARVCAAVGDAGDD